MASKWGVCVCLTRGCSAHTSALASHCFGHSSFMGRRRVNLSPTWVKNKFKTSNHIYIKSFANVPSSEMFVFD